VKSGFDPEAFWRETPRSFVNAMEGAALRDKQQLDLAFWQAWHTEAFARMEGRDFKAALRNHFSRDDKSDQRLKNAEAIAFFHRLKARGVPVKITRH
jgi:hypothetical protein